VIRLFIVATSPLARAGLQSLFGMSDVKVVGSAANLESLADQWSDAKADIILVDLSGEPVEGAMDSLARFQPASEAVIVVLSDHSVPRWFAEMLRAGIRSVLPSDISPEQLIAALEAAATGLIVMHPTGVEAMFPPIEPASRPPAELNEILTPRESEVLQMLASGLANKEIAARLAISEHTVKFHVASVLGKLGAGSRTEAVSIGIRRGLVLL
jgi:two-component system, NarL family, response regulator YdfI